MDIAIALTLYVMAAVLWIGGVGLVTTALLLALRWMPDAEQRIAPFGAVERRFGAMARSSAVLAGVTGLYLMVRLDPWGWSAALPYWWVSVALLVWLLFATLLFAAEPLFLQRCFAVWARANPESAFRMRRLHRASRLLSLINGLGPAQIPRACSCSAEGRRGGEAASRTARRQRRKSRPIAGHARG